MTTHTIVDFNFEDLVVFCMQSNIKYILLAVKKGMISLPRLWTCILNFNHEQHLCFQLDTALCIMLMFNPSRLYLIVNID